MNEANFDKLIEQAEQKNSRILQNQEVPPQIFNLKPWQATQIELMLNQQPAHKSKGYLMQQIRTPQQTLYKPALKKQDVQTFAECQEKNLIQLYRQMDSVKSKMSQNELHCFITLQQLRRHPLSKYFMALPDPLYLERYDINKEILQPHDIRTIANKLLRRKYKSLEEFQVDMVTMIHNFRVYFLLDKELFDISIKFEMLFWDFYSNQQSSNKKAIQTYKYYKSRCTSTLNRQKKQKSQIPLERKKKLTKQFNSQPIDAKKKIIVELQKGVMKEQFKKLGNQSNISKFKDQFFQQLQQLLEAFGEKNEESLQKKKKVESKEKLYKDKQLQALKNKSPSKSQSKKEKKQAKKKDQIFNSNSMQAEQDEIYYSDEQQLFAQRLQSQKMAREDVKQVMDMINEEAFFDSEDYD